MGGACFKEISEICLGSMESHVCTGVATVLAFFITPFTMLIWRWDVMSLSYKFFFIPGFFICVRDSVYVAKLVRDRELPRIAKELSMPYQLLVASSWAVSLVIYLVLLFIYSLDDWSRHFILMGWGLAVTQVFALTKHVRDRMDMQVVIASTHYSTEEEPFVASVPEPEARSTPTSTTFDIPPPVPVLADPHPSGMQHGPGGSMYPEDASLESTAKEEGQKDRRSLGISPPKSQCRVPPIHDLVAPLQQRGEAAKLMFRQKSLS